MNRLNIFDIGEITSLPEEPDPSINYSIIDDRFNILELKLTSGQASVLVASELKTILLSSVWTLLENDCNFLEYSAGIRLVREFIRIDDESNPVYQLPNPKAEQRKISPKLSITLILLKSNLSGNEEDLLSDLNAINFAISEVASDGAVASEQEYEEIIDKDSYSLYAIKNKLTEAQKLAMWKLIYALFYYQAIDNALDQMFNYDRSSFMIPLNNAGDQISILKKLLDVGSYNSKLLKEYSNLQLITHISTHRSDLSSFDPALDDPGKHILTSLLYIEEDLLLATTKSYGMGGHEFPDEVINFITSKYIGL